MVIFHSYVSLPEGNYVFLGFLFTNVHITSLGTIAWIPFWRLRGNNADDNAMQSGMLRQRCNNAERPGNSGSSGKNGDFISKNEVFPVKMGRN